MFPPVSLDWGSIPASLAPEQAWVPMLTGMGGMDRGQGAGNRDPPKSVLSGLLGWEQSPRTPKDGGPTA